MNTRKLSIIVSIVLILSVFNSLIPSNVYAQTKENHTSKEETIDNSPEYDIDGEEQLNQGGVAESIQNTFIMIRDRYSNNGTIIFNIATSVFNYYTTENVNVISFDDTTMQFEISVGSGFGSFNLYFSDAQGHELFSTLYTFCENNFAFASVESKDDAWYKLKEYQCSEGTITMQQFEDACTDYSRTFVTIDEPQYGITQNTMSIVTASEAKNASVTETNSDSVTITGRLRWELKDGTKLPLKNTMIELWEDGVIDYRIKGGYTDSDGLFSFTIDNTDEWYYWDNGGADVYIRMYPASETIFLFDLNQPTSDFFSTHIVYNIANGSTAEINSYIKYGNEEGEEPSVRVKRFHVQQWMTIGERFALSMGMEMKYGLRVYYPFPTDVSGCYTAYCGIAATDFDNFDTIIHEYGHYVECTMGTYGRDPLEMLCNGVSHTSAEDHFSDSEMTKTYAMELTWSEAWANAFSQIAQKYFTSEYVGVSSFANHYSTEYYTVGPYSCEAQEKAVTAFLWDIYDSASEAGDNLSVSARVWWNMTTRAGTYTLTDFVNVIESHYPNYRSAIGELLGAHQIAPSDLKLTNPTIVSDEETPALSWRVNGSVQNPNNRFQVVFFNNYGEFIYETPVIENNSYQYNQEFTYIVPEYVWNRVIKNYAGTFTINIAVKAFNSNEPVSGPYISKYTPLTLTLNPRVALSDNTRYYERIVKLDKGAYYDMNISFATSGYKLIQTFGTKDTKLELYSSAGTLLVSSDDEGYSYNALLTYEVQAHAQYKLRIKFYSSFVYGETKLAITPAKYLKTSGSESINSYEAILHVQNELPVEFGAYVEQDYVMVFRYVVPSSGDYTFTITSDFDTYMYVIDPRSSELLAYGTNYNDDSGEGLNPLITTHLDAGVPYLIIFSAYNPHSVTDYPHLYISITEA